ncbi:TNT domain-containing protein, partial [Arsukibacterium sp. MJ3]|uniref:TNT domain-containing protein n=1 Tax=Arsukibacterium sp. MJ3 TaxID=1632859 RepID=UPI00128CEF75
QTFSIKPESGYLNPVDIDFLIPAGLLIKLGKQTSKRLTRKVDDVVWPPNRGFDGDSVPASLIPGAKIDRFGSPHGTFVSPDGTPFSARSLPASSANKPLNTYVVVKPIQVEAGNAAPWFNQPGGGIQFELPKTVQELVDSGHLK